MRPGQPGAKRRAGLIAGFRTAGFDIGRPLHKQFCSLGRREAFFKGFPCVLWSIWDWKCPSLVLALDNCEEKLRKVDSIAYSQACDLRTFCVPLTSEQFRERSVDSGQNQINMNSHWTSCSHCGTVRVCWQPGDCGSGVCVWPSASSKMTHSRNSWKTRWTK